MSLFEAITECLCLTGHPNESDVLSNRHSAAIYTDTKEQPAHTVEDAASDFVRILRTAEKGGKDLQRALDDVVREYGWTENFAKAILDKLEAVLKAGVAMAQAMTEAVEKAIQAAVGFAREHPVYTTLIALGVLVILTPWAIEALGFGELGPIEGSFASWWQARYAGYVPKGSLFSFFQRLGMIWK